MSTPYRIDSSRFKSTQKKIVLLYLSSPQTTIYMIAQATKEIKQINIPEKYNKTVYAKCLDGLVFSIYLEKLF